MSTCVIATGAVSQASVAPVIAGATNALLGAAAGAACVVAAGAAAYLLARASVAAAEAGAEALIRLDEAMKRQADEQVHAQQFAEDWRAAAAAVCQRNASIRTLNGQAKRYGVDIPLPPPLDLAGNNLCQIHAWCHQTDQALSLAKPIVLGGARKAASAAAKAKLATGLPVWQESLAHEIEDRYEAALLASAEKDKPPRPTRPLPTPAEAPALSPVVAARVTALLDSLPHGVDSGEYAAIARQAAHALGAPSLPQSRTEILQLETMVRKASTSATIRADDRRFALRHLDLLHAAPIVAAFRSGDAETVAELSAVADGTMPLSNDLRRKTVELYERSREQAQRAFLRERVAEFLSERGYDVRISFSNLDNELDGLRVRHVDLGDDEATVLVRRDEVSAHLVRRHSAEGDQSRAQDRSHCAVLQRDIEAMSGELLRIGATHAAATSSGPESIIDARDSDSNQYTIVEKVLKAKERK